MVIKPIDKISRMCVRISMAQYTCSDLHKGPRWKTRVLYDQEYSREMRRFFINVGTGTYLAYFFVRISIPQKKGRPDLVLRARLRPFYKTFATVNRRYDINPRELLETVLKIKNIADSEDAFPNYWQDALSDIFPLKFL